MRCVYRNSNYVLVVWLSNITECCVSCVHTCIMPLFNICLLESMWTNKHIHMWSVIARSSLTFVFYKYDHMESSRERLLARDLWYLSLRSSNESEAAVRGSRLQLFDLLCNSAFFNKFLPKFSEYVWLCTEINLFVSRGKDFAFCIFFLHTRP